MVTAVHDGGMRIESSTAAQLLDATGALMAERNSVSVTFADIAEKSGINSALIRYHFGSKTGLFRALLERDAGASYASLEQLVAANMTAAQKLRRHVHGVIKVFFRYPYVNRLLAMLATEADADTAAFISDRFTQPLAAAQRAILEQGGAEGSFRRVDPMLFYFTLVGACDHLFYARHSLHHAFGIDRIDEDLRRAYADHVANILMRSILVDPDAE